MIRFLFFGVLVFLMSSCNSNSNTEVKTQELPLISISEPGKLNWNEKVPCDVWYVDGKDSVFLTAGIKFRGERSRFYPKKSFSIEFDEKIQIQNFRKDDDWILNSSYIDKTFMRNELCYTLFREMHSTNRSSKTTFVKLFLSGKYHGLYILQQEINASMLGLSKSDEQAVLFKSPPIFTNENNKLKPIDQSSFNQKFPKLEDYDKSATLLKFSAFIHCSTDEHFKDHIYEWIDLRNVVDWYILLQFAHNEDGLTKNFYLYKQNHSTPYRIAIWDFDHSFGRDGDNEKNEMNTPMNMKKSLLFRRLLEIKSIGFEEMVQKRWSALRKAGVFSTENVFSKMDEMDAQIKLEQTKNFTRWPVKSEWYFDANSYEQEVEWMKKSIRKRIAQLDKKFKYNI